MQHLLFMNVYILYICQTIKNNLTMTDPKEPQEEEIDPSEDRENDADYYNELESNFNNIWK